MSLPEIVVPKFEVILPSTGQKILCRPFLVKEEKILLIAAEEDSESAVAQALRDLVNNCTFGKLNADTLPVFDLEYLFLKIRSKSVGETVEPTIVCGSEKCQHHIKLSVDLSKVEVQKTQGHTNRIELGNGIGLVMTYPTYKTFEEKILNSKGKSGTEVLFETVIDCIECIYDAQQVYAAKDCTRKSLQDFIGNLTNSQFNQIQQFFDTMPRLSHTVDFVCPKCKQADKIVLESVVDFFA